MSNLKGQAKGLQRGVYVRLLDALQTAEERD